MTPEQFVYWLQGFFELQGPSNLDINQTKIIKDHLKEVFVKVTPNRNLNETHIQLPAKSHEFNITGPICTNVSPNIKYCKTITNTQTSDPEPVVDMSKVVDEEPRFIC